MNNPDFPPVFFNAWTRTVSLSFARHFINFPRGIGISPLHLGALLLIFQKGTCSISDICDSLLIQITAASQMLDNMYNRGLITRDEDPQDRRSKIIGLTDKGFKIAVDFMQTNQALLLLSFQELNALDKHDLIEFLHLFLEQGQVGADPGEEDFIQPDW
jgi:DNA-binding MarR family transcriptional regulator